MNQRLKPSQTPPILEQDQINDKQLIGNTQLESVRLATNRSQVRIKKQLEDVRNESPVAPNKDKNTGPPKIDVDKTINMQEEKGIKSNQSSNRQAQPINISLVPQTQQYSADYHIYQQNQELQNVQLKMKQPKNLFEKREQLFLFQLIFDLTKQIEVIRYIMQTQDPLNSEKASLRFQQVIENIPYQTQQLTKNKRIQNGGVEQYTDFYHYIDNQNDSTSLPKYFQRETVKVIFSYLNIFAQRYLLQNRQLDQAYEMVKMASLICRHFPLMFTFEPDLLYQIQQNICLLKLKGMSLSIEPNLLHLLGIQSNNQQDEQLIARAISLNNQAVMCLARADFNEAQKCSIMSIKCIEERLFTMIDEQLHKSDKMKDVFRKMLDVLLIAYLNLSESTLDSNQFKFNKSILQKGLQLSYQFIGEDSAIFQKYMQKFNRVVYQLFQSDIKEESIASQHFNSINQRESEFITAKTNEYLNSLNENPYSCYFDYQQYNLGTMMSSNNQISQNSRLNRTWNQLDSSNILDQSKIPKRNLETQKSLPIQTGCNSNTTQNSFNSPQEKSIHINKDSSEEIARIDITNVNSGSHLAEQDNSVPLEETPSNQNARKTACFPFTQTQITLGARQFNASPTINQGLPIFPQKSLSSDQQEYIEQKLEQERIRMRTEVLKKLQETKSKFEEQMKMFQMQMIQQQMNIFKNTNQNFPLMSPNQSQFPLLQDQITQNIFETNNQNSIEQIPSSPQDKVDQIQQQGENIIENSEIKERPNKNKIKRDSSKKLQGSNDQKSKKNEKAIFPAGRQITIENLSSEDFPQRLEVKQQSEPYKVFNKTGVPELKENSSLIPKDLKIQFRNKRRSSYSFSKQMLVFNPLHTVKSNVSQANRGSDKKSECETPKGGLERRKTLNVNSNIHDSITKKMSKKMEESQFQDVWITNESRMFLRNKSMANRQNSIAAASKLGNKKTIVDSKFKEDDDNQSLAEESKDVEVKKRIIRQNSAEKQSNDQMIEQISNSNKGIKNNLKLLRTQDSCGQSGSVKSKTQIAEFHKQISRNSERNIYNPFKSIESRKVQLSEIQRMVDRFCQIQDDALKQKFYTETLEREYTDLKVRKNIFMLRSILYTVQFGQLYSPYKLWAIKTNIIHEICQSKEPIISSQLIQVVVSQQQKAFRNIKVYIVAQYNGEKTKYDPRRLEKSMDREYLQNLAYSIKISLYAELDKKSNKDSNRSLVLQNTTNKIDLNLVDLQNIMCLFKNIHKINSSFESSLPLASIDTFDHLCKSVLFKYINLKKVKNSNPNECPYRIDFQSQPRTKSFIPQEIQFLTNDQNEQVQVDLYHLNDITWRLIISMPQDQIKKKMEEQAKENGFDMKRLLNEPNHIFCYSIDIKCESIEVAKKFFKKLQVKSLKFQTEQKNIQSLRQSWAIIQDFNSLYKNHFEKFVVALQQLLREEYIELNNIKKDVVPYESFISFLQTRKLVNAQIQIFDQYSEVFKMEMIVVLRKPGEEKDLKFISFYSNHNTEGKLKKCDIIHETSVNNVCSIFAQKFDSYSYESFYVLKQTCRQYQKTLRLEQFVEEISESESGFSSDSMGSGSFDSDESNEQKSSKKKEKPAPVQQMKLMNYEIQTLLYRRVILKIPRTEREYAVVTCELLICEKIKQVMGLKLTLFDQSRKEQQGIYLNINQVKWPKIKGINNQRDKFYSNYSVVTLLRNFGLQYLLMNCIFLKVPYDKALPGKYVMFIQTKENLLLQTEYGSQNRNLCEDQYAQHTIKPLEYYITMNQLTDKVKEINQK